MDRYWGKKGTLRVGPIAAYNPVERIGWPIQTPGNESNICYFATGAALQESLPFNLRSEMSPGWPLSALQQHLRSVFPVSGADQRTGIENQLKHEKNILCFFCAIYLFRRLCPA